MFNYHFKDKQEFIRRVMQEVYEEFFEKFSFEVSNPNDAPEVQLRKAILAGAHFLRDNRQLILALARDAMEGEPEIVRFLEKNFHRHITILIGLFRKCKKAGVMGDWPIPVAIAFLAGSVLAPSIMAAVVERTRFHTTYELLKKIMVPRVLSDKAIQSRLDLAFFALSGGNGKLPERSGAGEDDIEALWRQRVKNSKPKISSAKTEKK
jgi:AcrR family transcriptional regulator